MGTEMNEFKSWRSFSEFWRSTIRKHRYIRPSEIEDFLQTVLSTSKARETTIQAGRIFWRAQLGYEVKPYYQDGEYIDDLPVPYRPERMKPLCGESVEGRVNPKGIPYLYLASHRDTALSEVRPWIGALISVAQFKTVRKLKVINCSSTEARHIIYLEEPDLLEREQAVWSDIDRTFSTPITTSDRTAEYAPTQIIADWFMTNGLDGIAYRSALGSGHNVTLFDLDAAELINCSLFEVKEIKFAFAKAGNPYFVKKHYENKGE
jgi:RES domain-containing protein